MRKTFTPAVLLLLLLLSVISGYAGPFSGGNGTKSNPYQLSTKADFEALADSCKDDYNMSVGNFFEISKDIKEAITRPVPHFFGYLDGKRHILTLELNISDTRYVGLTGIMGRGAQIKNLGLKGNINCTGGGGWSWPDVGSFAGKFGDYDDKKYCSLDNCFSECQITVNGKYSDIGGLVGAICGGDVSNSYYNGTILILDNGSYIGGINGYGYDTRISNSYTSGSITISKNNMNSTIGGLFGYICCIGSNIDNNYSTMTINCDSADKIGPLLGGISDNNHFKVSYFLHPIQKATNKLGTHKTDAEMKSVAFVDLLNSRVNKKVWKQDINNINSGYPILSWQDNSEDESNKKYITLTVKPGANIRFEFRADAPNTPVKIVSGNNTKDVIVGTKWYDDSSYVSSFFVTADGNTMRIYGDIVGFRCQRNNDNISGIDVTQNKELRVLTCFDNNLTSLDVSKNTELIHLSCGGNPFTQLDITNNTKLQYLSCGVSNLTSLDVSKNTLLELLSCYNSKLKKLDLKNNKELTYLGCDGNQLTYLDLSHNTKIDAVWCFGNPFTTEEMNKVYCSLPDRSGKSKGAIHSIFSYYTNNQDNILAATSDNARKKNWHVRYYNTTTEIPSNGNYVCGSDNNDEPDPTPGDYSNYALKIHTWKSGLNENNLQYIAADGTSSIVLEVTGGKIPKGTTLTINSDDNKDFGTVYLPNMSLIRPENMYNAKWTPINKSISNLESSFIKYVAPAGLGDIKNNERIITFTITLPDNSKLTKKIKLIRPPVVFIHGKGSSKEAWNEMYNHFAKSNLYKSKNEIPFHFYAYDYNKYAEESFKDNTEKNRIVQRAITTVKTGLTLQGVLVKKVDVVGHSMGGVLTRTYLQSQYYNDDIRRMVTLATPHSGAQSANLLSFAEIYPPLYALLWTLKKIKKVDFISNATNDLRVDSWATRQYLNGKDALERQNKVPSFAIGASTLNLRTSIDYISEYLNPKTAELFDFHFKHFLNLIFKTYLSVKFLKYYEMLNFIYDGPNDFIVSQKSQLGGLSQENHQVFVDTWHNSITSKTRVLKYVIELLQSPKSDTRWHNTGWNPLTLNFVSFTSKPKIKPQDVLQSESSFVRFLPDKEEDNAVAGKEYTINIEASTDVVELDVLVLGENYENLLNVKNPTSPTNIKISIPDSLIGDLHIMAFGKTADSSAVVDNLLLHLENPKVKLESLSLEFANVEEEMNDPEVLIDMNISDWQQFSVMGHFSDGSVREITDFPGVEFTLSKNNVHIKKPGVLLAKKQGTEKLVVTYKEKSVSQKINISPHTLELVAFPKNSGIVGISDVQINSDSVEVKTLLPLAAKDYTFSGWFMDGEFVSNEKKLELTMIRPYQVVAYFEPKTGAAKIKGFAFPNPVKDNVTLSFDVVTPGVYTFELYQELGQHLQTINKKYYREGTHTIEFNTQSLAPGRYFCQILRQGVSLGEIAFVVTK